MKRVEIIENILQGCDADELKEIQSRILQTQACPAELKPVATTPDNKTPASTLTNQAVDNGQVVAIPMSQVNWDMLRVSWVGTKEGFIGHPRYGPSATKLVVDIPSIQFRQCLLNGWATFKREGGREMEKFIVSFNDFLLGVISKNYKALFGIQISFFGSGKYLHWWADFVAKLPNDLSAETIPCYSRVKVRLSFDSIEVKTADKLLRPIWKVEAMEVIASNKEARTLTREENIPKIAKTSKATMEVEEVTVAVAESRGRKLSRTLTMRSTRSWIHRIESDIDSLLKNKEDISTFQWEHTVPDKSIGLALVQHYRPQGFKCSFLCSTFKLWVDVDLEDAKTACNNYTK